MLSRAARHTLVVSIILSSSLRFSLFGGISSPKKELFCLHFLAFWHDSYSSLCFRCLFLVKLGALYDTFVGVFSCSWAYSFLLTFFSHAIRSNDLLPLLRYKSFLSDGKLGPGWGVCKRDKRGQHVLFDDGPPGLHNEELEAWGTSDWKG